MNTVQIVMLVAVLIASVVVHEVAHAWQARREGDHTAEREGRITLNPLPHLDPVGSVIVPVLLALYGGIVFGWAKPVPVNPANYRNYVWGDIRVSMAGIVSNLLLALLATVLSGVVLAVSGASGYGTFIFNVLNYAILINLILAFFNLIPIPPLDGSHVVAHMLPKEVAQSYRELGRYGLILVIAFVFLVPGGLNFFLGPVYYFMGLADLFIRQWL